MEGLDHGENHIRGVVFISGDVEPYRRFRQGSSSKDRAGTRATGMRSDARRVQATPRVRVMVKVGVRDRGCDL